LSLTHGFINVDPLCELTGVFFFSLLEMYPPLTVGNISMAGSALSYVDDVAYRDWMVRQQWAYDKQSVIDALDPGFLYQNDAIFSYPVEKAVCYSLSI